MGLFTKTSGRGWSLDKGSGRLTINGELDDVYRPFEKIAKMVRSVVALDGARVRDGRWLFSDMKKLESADLSKLDVSMCTDMTRMFNKCKSLTALNLTGWKTAKVTDMSSMFQDCESLTSIDVTGWDTSNVRRMSCMFDRCESLESVDLASLDLSSVESLFGMFSSCKKLSYVKIGALSAAVKLTDISLMFKGCDKLRKIETAGWPSKSLEECMFLFEGCKSIEELDLRSMDVTNVQDISYMFSDCSNLRTLDLSGWDVRKIKKMEWFCKGCKHLETLDLRGWQINKDIYAHTSFDEVPKNVHILVSDKTTQEVFSTQAVFYKKCLIRTDYTPSSENADITAEKPAVKEEPKPAAPEPVTQKPAASKPAAQKPAEQKPAAPKPDSWKLLMEGHKAKEAGDIDEALELYEQAAEMGDAEAMYAAADLSFSEDYLEDADMWAQKAKASGRLPADTPIDELILLIDNEKLFYAATDAEKAGNHEEAFRLCKKAADRGDDSACYLLALYYEDGTGVEPNEAESFRYCLKAAELDRGDAMRETALRLHQGKGVAADDEKALYWAKKAKESGELSHPDEMDELIKKIEDSRKSAAPGGKNKAVEQNRPTARPTEKKEQAPVKKSERPSDQNAGGRVVIADDAVFMRQMMKDILTKAGLDVVGEAADGNEAVELYRALKPDIVTLDITMPNLDGIGALRQIMAADPEAVCIMISAMGQQAMVVAALENGARDFITKPFMADTLKKTVLKYAKKARINTTEKKEQAPVKKPEKPSDQNTGRRILIADDSAIMRRRMKETLTKAGFDVVGEAADGNEAVEQYRALKPDIVTLDVTMPNLDGVGALRQIMAADPEAVCIMCAAAGEKAKLEDALQNGARDYIAKPLMEDTVKETVLKYAKNARTNTTEKKEQAPVKKPEAKTEPKAEAKPEPKAETKTAVKEGPNPAITPSLNHQDEKQTTEAATTKSTPQPKQKQKEKAITKASPVKKPKQQSTTVSSQKTDIEDEKAALLEKLAKQQAEVDALKAQLAALQTNKEEKKAAGQKEEKKAARQKEESKTIAKGKKQPEKAKETTGQKEPLPSAVKVQAAQDPASTADQGEREAAYNLALMYTDGNGDVPKDYLKALELFCKAADQGHEKAQKILRSSGIHRAKTSYNVPVSHKPNPAEKKNYENKRHIKVAVIGDCLVGKTTLLSALSCYFSQNYPSYENYYMTREEIKEIQARGAHGLCKEHGYQHEPFYMFLEDPDFLYTFIEIPSVLDFMKNIQQGMYAADIAIYVATVQHGAANSSKYLQLAINAGIPGFIAFQTTLEPNPDQDLINLASFDLIGAAHNLEIPLEQTVDGTHLEYQIDEKGFTLCLAELMKEVRDTATSNVGNIAPDLPTLMSIKKVSRKRDGSLLALGVISRGTLLAGDSVEICGYYDTLIPATCAEIQIFNLSVPIANCGDFVSVRLTDLPPGFVIRAGQFISKPGCIRLANSITIEGNAPTWENGGRHTPFFTGYQPLLLLGPSAVSATVTEMGDMMVTPGEHFTLRLELDKPLPVIHGLRAVLCDGVIVGTGMISEYSE